MGVRRFFSIIYSNLAWNNCWTTRKMDVVKIDSLLKSYIREKRNKKGETRCRSNKCVCENGIAPPPGSPACRFDGDHVCFKCKVLQAGIGEVMYLDPADNRCKKYFFWKWMIMGAG